MKCKKICYCLEYLNLNNIQSIKYYLKNYDIYKFTPNDLLKKQIYDNLFPNYYP